MNNAYDIQTTLIGLLLKYPDQYIDISDLIKPKMFDSALQPLVKVLFEWCSEKQEIDILLLSADTGVDHTFLRELYKRPAKEEVIEYAKRINQAYLDRYSLDKLSNASKDIEAGISSQKIISQVSWIIEQEVSDCSPLREERISDAVKQSLDVFYKSLNDKEISGIDTGYTDLNSIMGGWQPSDQIVIAGRPGMGKTTLALNFALKVAEQDIPIAIFSLEMSKVQLINVLASILTGISTEKIRAGNLNQYEIPTLEKAYHKISNLPIFLLDQIYDIADIAVKVSQLKRRYDIKIVFYDYLQLMNDRNKYNSRHHQVEYASRRLKQLAKKEEITSVVLAQLSRVVESRSDKKPMLSDLKESGSIEEDADMVMMIYREGYYELDNNDTTTELLIRKYRHGRTGRLLRSFENRQFKMIDQHQANHVPF